MKLSIITINYNNCKGLENTIKSVINQKFNDFEFLIIDGNSSDGSLQLIKEYSSHINYYISENDNGIYHAMNKGIKQAKGDYIHLLNSGDIYYNRNVLTNVIFNDYDFLSFATLKKGNKDWVYLPMFNNNLNSFEVPHPGVIVKREYYFKNGFYDENYKIISDSIYLIKNMKENNSILSYDILTIAEANGISARFSFNHEFEKLHLINMYNISFFKKMKYFFLNITLTIIKKIIKL
jgi:glycosyltransferase involved in cell wall biosynthesis